MSDVSVCICVCICMYIGLSDQFYVSLSVSYFVSVLVCCIDCMYIFIVVIIIIILIIMILISNIICIVYQDGRTALMWASENGDKEVVKLLLDHGADTNLKDKVSVTDMIYMRDVYDMYVNICVYDCMINTMFVCLFN